MYICSVTQLCPALCDLMDYSPPGPFVHGISQERILERVAISFWRESSLPRDRTCVSYIAGRFFTCWAIGKNGNKLCFFLFSNWDIIASRFCVSFCCTIKCISYGCTYIPFLLAVPSILSILHIYVTTEHQAELPVLHSSFPLAPWHMVVYICQF